MKTLLTLCLILLVAGCGGQMTSSVMTAQNTDLAVRAGILDGDTEAGVVVKYATSDEIEWGPEPDIYGGYVIFHLTQEVTIEDTPEYSILQPFLETLHARPYAGLEIVGSSDKSMRNFQPNWIAGTAFTLSEDGNISLNVEYVDGDFGSSDVFVGIQARF